MTEFIPIKDAKKTLKGSFIGTVISVGALKSGTTKDKDWSQKKFIIEDATDKVELVTWNGDIDKFKIGYKYEIIGPWWKVYEGKITVELGNYGQSKVVGSAKVVPTEESTPNTPPESTTSDDSTTESLPKLSELFANFIHDDTIVMLQIEQGVRATMKSFGQELIDAKIGMITKELYRETKKTNLKKAADL